MSPVKLSVPYYNQNGAKWCGPTCLAMVLRYYGESVHNFDISDYLDLGHDALLGTRLVSLDSYMKAKYPHYETRVVTYTSKNDVIFEDIKNNINAGYPVILALQRRVGEGHAVVAVGYDSAGTGLFVNDPSGTLIQWVYGTYDTQTLANVFVSWNSIKPFMATFIRKLPWTGTVMIVHGSAEHSVSKGTIDLHDGYVMFENEKGGKLMLYLDKDFPTWKSYDKHPKNVINNRETMYVYARTNNHLEYKTAYSLLASVIDTATGKPVATLTTKTQLPKVIDPYKSIVRFEFDSISTSWLLKGHRYSLQITLTSEDGSSKYDEVIVPLPTA